LKTTFIAKALSVLLACFILALFLVPTGFAHRIGMTGGEPGPATSCNDSPDTLTIFPYAKFATNADGSATGVEVHLSSAWGNCSTKIYSSHEEGYAAHSGNHHATENETFALR